MTRRLWFVLLLFPIFSLQAQGPVRYRLESKSGSRMEMPAALTAMAASEGADMSSLFGAFDDKPVTTTAVVRITTRDSAGGVVVHLVVDSMMTDQFASLDNLKSKLPAEMLAMIAIVPGATLDAFMLKGTTVWSRGTPTMNIAVNRLSHFLPMLFPFLPKDATRGSTWADTMRVKSTATSNPTADEAMVANLMTTTNQAATVTTWKMASADSLVSETSSSSAMTMAKTISTGTVNAAKQYILLDAARAVRQALLELTATTSISMGEMGDVSTIASNTLTVTRLGAKP